MNITLALGGGGAKGNSHIGVIRRLEKEGIKIDAVAGTSFGGVIAVFYALGYSTDQIEDLFALLDQTQLYGIAPNESPSLFGLPGITKWLIDVLGDKTFDDLKIPCAVTAVDLQCGCEVILSKGSLVDSLLATIAVPGIFPARHIGEWELVDGGTLDPVPVALVRTLITASVPVIAVVLTKPMGVPAQTWNLPFPNYLPRTLMDRLSKSRYALALDVFSRSLDIVTRAVTEYRLEVDRPEIILRPEVTDIDTLDLVDVREIAKKGEESVEAALPEIKKLFTWQNRLRRTIGVRT